MLYDPKWHSAKLIASVECLITWLEKQPPDAAYCYSDNGGCLLHQYFSAHGWRDFEVGGMHWWPIERQWESNPLPYGFEDISADTPHTFGAALDRARAFRDR